jgi:hypothetical protein
MRQVCHAEASESRGGNETHAIAQWARMLEYRIIMQLGAQLLHSQL